MDDSGDAADPALTTSGHLSPDEEEQEDGSQDHEQEAGSQTTEEEVPPREGTAPPEPPQSPPAPEPPQQQVPIASSSASGRPKPQYQLKYTMAGAVVCVICTGYQKLNSCGTLSRPYDGAFKRQVQPRWSSPRKYLYVLRYHTLQAAMLTLGHYRTGLLCQQLPIKRSKSGILQQAP